MVELRPKFYLSILQINLHKRRTDRISLLISTKVFSWTSLFEHRAKVFDNIARPVSITYNSIQSFAHLFEVGFF